MAVTGCICFNQTFAEALRTARKFSATNVEQLQYHLEISAKCGLCIPYVQQTIETGVTEFAVMNEADIQYWSSRAGEVRKGGRE
ncbi:MAG: (2Fe-2S)-binding protein [Candidatus Kapaibacterium sp.]